MDTAPYAEKMTSFQKMALQSVKSSLNLIQTQSDDVVNRMMDHAHWMPDVYRTPIKKWQKFSSRELDLMVTFMDNVFSSYESVFVRPPKKATPKPRVARKNEAVTEKPKMEVKNEP
jgi:hypothetical protein